MRLNYLTLCLCILAVSACSSAPIRFEKTVDITATTSNHLVAQRATQALNSIYEQSNFNFSGRIDADIQLQNKNTKPVIMTPEQKKLIESYLRLNAIHLSDLDRQQLFNLVTVNQNKQTIFNNSRDTTIYYILSNLAKYTELSYRGGLDYRKKLFNIEFEQKYHSANTLFQQRYPVLVDFHHSRAYLNYFNPNLLTGKAKQYYQAYYLDFYKHRDTTLKSVDWKKILDYLKASNSTYFTSLIGQERIETLMPSNEEHQQGVVEKIRLYTSVENLLLKNVIFDIVNKQYTEKLIDFNKIKKALLENVQKDVNKTKQKQTDSASEQAMALRDLIYEHYDNLYASETANQASKKENNMAPAKSEPVSKPSEKAKIEDEDNITPELTEEQCRKLIAKKEAFGRLTECRYEYGASIYQVKTGSKSVNASTNSIFKLMLLAKDENSEFYRTFSAYDKGRLTAGKALDDIIQKHEDIINPLLKDTSYPLSFDVTLDRQGRLIHNNIVAQLDTQYNNIQVKGSINYHSKISNYGQAKIETFNNLVDNAKPITEHPLITEALKDKNKDYDDSVENIVKKLIEQNYKKYKSYEKAYIIGFIALFSKFYPEMLSSVSAQDLQEIAKVYAYSYADESLYKLSVAEIKAVQALEKKHQLNSQEQMFNSLGRDVASLVEDVIKDQVISREDMALVKKYKTSEALFAYIYQREFIKEEYGSEQPSSEDKKYLAEAAQILAQAYTANKNGTLTLDTIKGLKAEHEDFFYSVTYLDSVLKTEHLLKFVKNN